MPKDLELLVNIDGAARGNPGPAAFGFVIRHDGEILLEEGGVLEDTTNNVAEYTALLKALAKARELKASSVLVRSDSELLVKQMNGQYKVKNPNLKELHQEATQLREHFRLVRFSHVPREENREADRLCNEALDSHKPAASSKSPAGSHRLALSTRKPSGDGRKAKVDWPGTLADAERLLREAALAWSEAGLDEPTPRAVIHKVVQLFEERGFLSR
jgi:ribonuclease HI